MCVRLDFYKFNGLGLSANSSKYNNMFTSANKIVSNNDWLTGVACHACIQEAFLFFSLWQVL